MKKYSPFIIVAVAVVAFVSLLLVSAKNKPRKFNPRVTLRQQDKNPYGTYAAYKLLPALFPKAKINYDKREPGGWDSLDTQAANQAVIMIAKDFNAEQWELEPLKDFIQKGNFVFIVTNSLSYDANNFLRSRSNDLVFEEYFGEGLDSLQVKLEKPPFPNQQMYQYPGRKYAASFSDIDSERTFVLGRDIDKKINFIQMNSGRGRLFVHLAPLAFSNYFLLHKENIHYYEQVLSVIPSNVRRITWNEYYLTKKSYKKEQEPGMFRVLFQYPAFKWGLLTAMFTLLLFALLHMRRKQRMIPVVTPPKNESLDFVKTIGRLYYDQHDHANLAKKMSVYFLDYLRSQYKIATNVLDDNFVAVVHAKTGYPEEELKLITGFILMTEKVKTISDEQLSQFYRQLENFYQNA